MSQIPDQKEQELQKAKSIAGTAVSDCMLEQMVGTTAGVAAGLALGYHRKSLRPFVYCITAGTVVDVYLGYSGSCKDKIREFDAARADYTKYKAQIQKEKESNR